MGANSPPPPPGVDTVEKGIKSITSLTKVLTEFLRWVAGMIRNRDWVGLLMFLIAVSLVFSGTKLTLATIVTQPIFYGVWGIFGVMFLVGLMFELRTKPPIKPPYRDPAKRKAIKFLSSFEEEDAEIYSRLQGYRDLRVIKENVVRPEFSFGVLKGKSGCGKSSYVKAGLLAALNKTEMYRGVYIKFSDSDSLSTVKDAFIDGLNLNKTEVEGLNFIELLKKGINAASESCEDFNCLILVFDQFEQFFVYTDNKIRRDNFIQELVKWYENDDLTEQVKILVSIREDWFASLDEIQEKLNYILRIGSQSGGNSFYIKNFSPEEATMILSVMAQEDLAIAENDTQGFERDYIQEVLEKELASVSDGLISPVDLQIIAETIKQQNTSAMRSFNRTVFQKLGGIEGLRRSFLESMLEPLGEERKKSAVQVLVALTNLEQQTRSQVQTLEQLQEKVQATIAANEVQKIVIYLQKTGLITVAEREGIQGFELSHEGMISAVIRLGEKIQDKAYRANQLLERRVNEWLGNRRSSRYYFNLKELWLIEQQKPYLRWGIKRQQKQELLQKSKQKIYIVLGIVGSIIFIVMGVWSWLNYTTTGMMTQVRWKLTNISEKISDPQYQSKAVTAFAKDGNFERALQLSDRINDSEYKANALRAIAETIGKVKEEEKALSLLEKALLDVENIYNSYDKANALRAIAETYDQLQQPDKALSLLEEALLDVDNIDDSSDKARVFKAISETIGKLQEPEKAVALLETIISAVDTLDFSNDKAKVFKAISETIGKLQEPEKAIYLLDMTLSYKDTIDYFFNKAIVLTTIAETYDKLNKPEKALDQIKEAVFLANNSIDYSFHRAEVLTVIAETYDKLNKPNQALFQLEQAFSSVDNIDLSHEKAEVFKAIAETIGKLQEPKKAVSLLEMVFSSVDTIDLSHETGTVLTVIAQTYDKLNKPNKPNKVISILEMALSSADTIDFPSGKADTLKVIAETIGKLKQPEKAISLLEKALLAADKIDSSSDKARVLTAISESAAKQKQWKLALKAYQECPGNDCEVATLANILTIHAEQENKE